MNMKQGFVCKFTWGRRRCDNSNWWDLKVEDC